MKKLAKRYAESVKLVEKNKEYEIKEALELIEKMPKAKFDETVELHVKLGVDSKHADQQVRGTVVLPNGTGKTQRVLVFAKGPKAEEAEKAGADFVGAEELIPKIQNENWFDYDVVVATPDMMGVVGRLGKVLGPKGLMPNPKSGTVTMDVTKAINEIKSGKVEYRLDKTNIIHLGFGKVSFGAEKLAENYDVIVATPDMMGVVGRLGKVLGPKGLMPNPKSGTVTMDVTKAINEIKSGKVEYRLDKTNIIHLGFGKVSFGADKLLENYETVINAIIKAKPAAAKGQYIKSVSISKTMGPGLYINQK